MPAFFTRFPTGQAFTGKFQDSRVVMDFPVWTPSVPTGSVFFNAQPADVAGWTVLKVNIPNSLLTAGVPSTSTGASTGTTVTDPATGGPVTGSTLTCQGSDPLIPFCVNATLPIQPVNV